MKNFFITLIGAFLLGSCNVSKTKTPFVHNGHAHNDYEHERPLYDALQYGFKSIEVDVHAWNDKLIVAHDSTDFSRLPDIMSLYINPLDSLLTHKLIDEKNLPIVLMVDLKTNKEIALDILDRLTKSRKELFYSRDKDAGPIQILISGEPSLVVLEQLDNPCLFIDGRFNREYPKKLRSQVTRISGKFFSLFGHVNGEERNNLINDYLSQAHSNNQKVRFWGTRDHPDTWNELRALNVDWIGTDDLAGFYNWSQKSD
ncbi:MAG: glycerophosphoryl diester phosphodiesterase [Saprospiraceae bacterium]|jgi:glycerophosphoryl diester phosphodiesterase